MNPANPTQDAGSAKINPARIFPWKTKGSYYLEGFAGFNLTSKPSIPDKGGPHDGSERELHAAEIALHGRMAWQKRHGYGKRSLVETAISRIKGINDGKLTSRTFGSQRNEIAIHLKIANRNMILARPIFERAL